MRSFCFCLWCLVVAGGVSACGSTSVGGGDSDASMDTGGAKASGGAMSSGGSKATGGSDTTGGKMSTGGATATGGSGGGTTCADLTCKAPAVCDDSGSTPVCACPDGYTDDNGDGSKCTDIDECADSSLNNCALRATCENTKGSFTCTCDAPLYAGDGTTCACATGYVPDPTDNTFCVADNGGDCADGLECASGNCVDGVCCATACIAPPPCRVAKSATCTDGVTCVYSEVSADNTDCDDGNTCTSGTKCSAGVCTGGVDVSSQCYASSCQAPICDGFAGCQVSATTGACDDGDPCTVGETCQVDGSCGGGTPYDCDDGEACTDDSCVDNGGSAQCVHSNNSDYCGPAGCPTKDMCVGGSCQADAGTACNGCTGSPCGAGGTCSAGSGGNYTCSCDSGYLPVNGTCVCDIAGTFAVQVTATFKYDGDSNSVLAPFDDVVVHSWIMRTHTISGADVLVTERPCGGETPDICNALTQEQYGLLPTEAYRGNIPDAAWDSPGMPYFNGQTMSLDTVIPGNAFVTGNEAMVLGLVMPGNDLMGTWPASADAVQDWTNPDGDSFNGVLTIWENSGKSTVCPRDGGTAPRNDLTLPPALDVQDDGQGGQVGVFTRVKYVDGASRVIKSYDGTIDDCDNLHGDVKGPSDASKGYPGQYAADARVRHCRHEDGSACTSSEIAFLDDNTGDSPYVKSATFLMKRMAAATSHTCAEVRAMFP